MTDLVTRIDDLLTTAQMKVAEARAKLRTVVPEGTLRKSDLSVGDKLDVRSGVWHATEALSAANRILQNKPKPGDIPAEPALPEPEGPGVDEPVTDDPRR